MIFKKVNLAQSSILYNESIQITMLTMIDFLFLNKRTILKQLNYIK